MEKKKNTILIILVCVIALIVMAIAFKLGMKSTDEEGPKDDTPSYEVLHVNQLSDRLSMISFSHQDYYEIAEANVTMLSKIENAHVSVKYTFDGNLERSYTVSSIPNILSVGCGIFADGTAARTYFLTKTGRVYILEDNLDSVKANEAYEGNPIDTKISNATEIFVANGNLMLNDKPYNEPAVFVKTSNGKLYTNEKMLIDKEQKGFVELK